MESTEAIVEQKPISDIPEESKEETKKDAVAVEVEETKTAAATSDSDNASAQAVSILIDTTIFHHQINLCDILWK